MLPVHVIGGPGKEVPPKESENELQEKGTVRAASELHEENAEPRRQWNASVDLRWRRVDAKERRALTGRMDSRKSVPSSSN